MINISFALVPVLVRLKEKKTLTRLVHLSITLCDIFLTLCPAIHSVPNELSDVQKTAQYTTCVDMPPDFNRPFSIY